VWLEFRRVIFGSQNGSYELSAALDAAFTEDGAEFALTLAGVPSGTAMSDADWQKLNAAVNAALTQVETMRVEVSLLVDASINRVAGYESASIAIPAASFGGVTGAVLTPGETAVIDVSAYADPPAIAAFTISD
jgi:hypothetical protein